MAIVFDNATGNGFANATTTSFSHTTGSGSNRFLFFATWSGAATTGNITSVTYAGVSLTKYVEYDIGDGTILSVWYLINPATGSNTLLGTATSSQVWEAMVSTYSGVKQSGFPDANTNNNSSGSVTNSVTSIADNCWHLCATGSQGVPGASTGSTQRIVQNQAGIFDSNGVIHPAGNNSMTLTTSPGGRQIGVVGVTISPITSIVYTLTAAQASFVLTGENSAITSARNLLATFGSFSLTGIAASINKPLHYLLNAATGLFSLIGQAVVFKINGISTSWIKQARSSLPTFTTQTKNNSSWTKQSKS